MKKMKLDIQRFSELHTYVNFEDYPSTNTPLSSQNLNSMQNSIHEEICDCVRLVEATYDSSITFDAFESKQISITIPTVSGYQCIGCVGGYGVGNTGLIVQASKYSDGINRWVTNCTDSSKTYSSIKFTLLYIKTV